MDMKFFKHDIPNLLRYWKINLNHYTYMRENADFPPNYNFTSFLRSKTASLANFERKFLECKKN
jgi:hypothetical protein